MPDKSVAQFANLPTSAIETAAQAEDGYRLAYELEAAGYPRAAQYLRVAEAAVDEANERAINAEADAAGCDETIKELAEQIEDLKETIKQLEAL